MRKGRARHSVGGEKLQHHNAPRLERPTETTLGERDHKKDGRTRNRDMQVPSLAFCSNDLAAINAAPCGATWTQRTLVLSALVLPDH